MLTLFIQVEKSYKFEIITEDESTLKEKTGQS